MSKKPKCKKEEEEQKKKKVSDDYMVEGAVIGGLVDGVDGAIIGGVIGSFIDEDD